MEGDQIEHIAIIGAGLMGLGIGLEFARFGYDVSLYNTTKETSDKAMDCC
jgi:3-hydroxyacyl-CoA dehydrogenase